MTDKPELPWSENPVWKDVSTGPGWYDIIARLDSDLRVIVPDYKVVQVKEKFGGLRYYTEFPSANYLEVKDQVEPLIRAAEEEASRTCEECGNPGTLRGGSWYRTLCEEDARKYEERTKRILAGGDEL